MTEKLELEKKRISMSGLEVLQALSSSLKKADQESLQRKDLILGSRFRVLINSSNKAN